MNHRFTFRFPAIYILAFLLFLFMACNGQKKMTGTAKEEALGSGSGSAPSVGNDLGSDSVSTLRSEVDLSPKSRSAIQIKENQGPDHLLTLVVSDSYSGIEQAETLVIRNSKGLQKFYSRINRTRKPGLPLPDIDFSREMVIVRCSGTTDNGAMPDLIFKEETAKAMTFGIRKRDENPESSAVTTPFSLYRMPLTKKEIAVQR